MSLDLTPFRGLRFARFSLLLEAIEELHLPEYKGSTIRGGFGIAFKKGVCMTKTFDCPPCMLQKACSYYGIFESKVDKGVADLLRIGKDAPHPFVLEPPLTDQRVFRKGEQFTVHLTLIGKAIDMLSHFVYAFTVLGDQVGLGKAKGKFVLRQIVDAEGKQVYSGDTEMLVDVFRVFRYSEFTDSAESKGKCKLTFLTPTRIMSSYTSGSRHLMRMHDVADFWTFIETLYHRLFALTNLYCSNEVADYAQHRPALNAVLVTRHSANIGWHDWERYSNRQQTRMKMGGFIGDATFEGELSEYMPLLRIGEYLHVGKSTGFGLGKFVLNV